MGKLRPHTAPREEKQSSHEGGHVRIPSRMVKDGHLAGLSGSELKIFLCLLAHENTTTGACYPSVARIMNLMGLSKQTVANSLRGLASKGWIEVDADCRPDVGGRCYRRNGYTILMHEKIGLKTRPRPETRPGPESGETWSNFPDNNNINEHTKTMSSDADGAHTSPSKPKKWPKAAKLERLNGRIQFPQWFEPIYKRLLAEWPEGKGRDRTTRADVYNSLLENYDGPGAPVDGLIQAIRRDRARRWTGPQYVPSLQTYLNGSPLDNGADDLDGDARPKGRPGCPNCRGTGTTENGNACLTCNPNWGRVQ